MNALKKVVVGLSGGVDSAVTALLLKQKGFNVIGVFMRNWDVRDELGHCQAESDLADAKYVAQTLDIPLHEVNFVKDYWNNVFEYMISEYETGHTPNPDIICNKNIKFSKFFEYVSVRFGADAVATGHYAKTSFGSFLEQAGKGNVHLLRAKDERKDQTFFLSQVKQSALQHSMFPLGDYTKSDVKNIARRNHLDKIALKKESMGICFIGGRKFQHFIDEYIPPCPGHFIDIDSGQIVGEHTGIHHWTIGQRCKIGGLPAPYYVAQKLNPTDILVAKGHDHPLLYTDNLTASAAHWIHSEPPELTRDSILNCGFRFQHGKPIEPCQVIKLSEDRLFVRLKHPLRAITPGQYAVFYLDNICLGSATIIQPGPCLQSSKANFT